MSSPGRATLVRALLTTVSLLLAILATLCTAQPANSSSVPLVNDVPLLGSLAANAASYYTFSAPAVSYPQSAFISVAASTGSPSLYVSLFDLQPSASSFDYAASWQTGGVVSISSQPPYTAYVAVVASPYSATNYTLLVTAYDSDKEQAIPIPLSSAQPLASVIAAGEYRYFAYTVINSSVTTTIALTEAYGQSWLLLNSPNTTQLPTVDSAQYASSDATFPLVALQQPAVGVWQVGVWSNASSAFTIIAADSTATTPVELGVTYPGYVQQGAYVYYSIYLDRALLAATNSNNSAFLTIDLDSLHFESSVYCSSFPAPTDTNSRWRANVYGHQDRIDIPSTQLAPGTVYCGVHGDAAGSYAFTASYNSTILLSAGEALTVQAAAYSTQLFVLVFPASTTDVTLSVVVDVGDLTLSIEQYGKPPTEQYLIASFSTQTTAARQLSNSQLCGLRNQNAIPGSSPPLCGLQILARASNLTEYRIVASTAGETVALAAGEPAEGIVTPGQPALLAFDIEDALSNVSLVLTVTNGAVGLLLTVDRRGASADSPTWQAAQADGSNVIVLQMDYTDPRVPDQWLSQNSWRGSWLAILTSSLETVAFSAVYTSTNGSIYSDSIVQLLEGVPQQAVVGAGGYMFFQFVPPLDGWPYMTTISVEWLSGSGTVRAEASTGPQVGPLLHDYVFTDPSVIAIPPETRLSHFSICDVSLTADCGYSISVYGDRAGEGQALFSIVVTTQFHPRTLYANENPAQSGSSLSADASEHWQTSVTTSSTAVNGTLLYALSVTSGSLTAYISNTSVAPNASNAQLAWPDLSSTAVLAYALAQEDANVQLYLSVVCTSPDGAPCEYTVLAQKYEYSPTRIRYRHYHSENPPTNVLLPPGAISYVGYDLQSSAVIPYFILEASAIVGQVTLYASCIRYAYASGPLAVPLPNETNYMWSAVDTPLVIDVFNFDSKASGCDVLVVGVRASGDQAAQALVSMGMAEELQSVTFGADYGVITPSYSASFFECSQWAHTQLTVLSFTLSAASTGLATCDISQLRLVVSDSVMFPDSSSPSSFNWTASPTRLLNGNFETNIAIGAYSQPPSSLQSSRYYVSVSGQVSATCKFQLSTWQSWDALVLSQPALLNWYPGVTAQYPTLPSLPAGAASSIGILFTGSVPALLALYVALDGVPSPDTVSSYMLSSLLNYTAVGTITEHSLYLPASACSPLASANHSCAVVLLASVAYALRDRETVHLAVQPMSAAASTWLTEDRPATPVTASALLAAYYFSLPASPLLVTLALNTSSPLTVWCSYQHVTPDAAFYDWQWQVNSSSSVLTPTIAQLNITWADTTAATTLPLLTNANTQLAATATTCYCSVQASSNGTYSIAYSIAQLIPSGPSTQSSSSSSASMRASAASSSSFAFASSSSHSSISAFASSPSASLAVSSSTASDLSSSHSSLNSGALAAAVVVPVLVVLLLLAGLLMWRLRSRGASGLCCCGEASSKQADGRARYGEDSIVEREVSMAELSHDSHPARNGRLVGRVVPSEDERW